MSALIDRVGIVFDITKLMSEQGLNIVSMEVAQKEGFAQISLEIERGDNGVTNDSLFALFETLPGLESQATTQGKQAALVSYLI